VNWDEINIALELGGIELWPGSDGATEIDVFCRPCSLVVGLAPLSLITTIALALEHVRSAHRGAPHSTCVEITISSSLGRTFMCGAGCPS